MIELAQDDFTVKVSGSTTLLELDTELARYGQLSTLTGPAGYSINQILLENWGFKNHQAVLGLSIEHKGISTKCGGQVIKNVSGYDLAKLYIGSRSAFGQITSAYLRTEKLASTELIYQCEYPAWELVLNWHNAELRIHNQETQIKLWGETDLLTLRANKLKDRGITATAKSKQYQKHYPETKTRLELSCAPDQLQSIYNELLSHCQDIYAYPQNSYIEIFSHDPKNLLNKIKSYNDRTSLIIYPITTENQLLEYYYNVVNPDEERIIEKLYAQFN